MTVIAWDGFTLAADKQSTQYSQKRTTGKIFKHIDSNGIKLFGICGDYSAGREIIEWARSGMTGEYPDNKAANDELKCTVVMIDQEKNIFKFENTRYPMPIYDKYYAAGSGQDYAIAAMHCGKTAKEAVEIASIYCTDCGMGVDTMDFTE